MLNVPDPIDVGSVTISDFSQPFGNFGLLSGLTTSRGPPERVGTAAAEGGFGTWIYRCNSTMDTNFASQVETSRDTRERERERG